ncbi:Protein CBG25612 [Caenorhabditis briggsae]|uniref:Protein CBG25612 n=3 Tax=Caenorhabditis briggsae TaxID=6238 RepID=B6IF97_CAEBR|nr:Protein CBG25612 [Caenorhabditis briggsae]ULU06378.1 hypothetical protein L3Y34_018322 [Caenorhabditis briggsae]CAR98577.1 Protein CBG25612 [Caenorhabditis briggsae]
MSDMQADEGGKPSPDHGEGASSALPVKEVIKEVLEAAKIVKMEKAAKCEAKIVYDDQKGSSSATIAPESTTAKKAARSRTDSGEDAESSASQMIQRSPSPVVAIDPPNTPEDLEKDPSPSEEEEEVSVNREDAPGDVEEQQGASDVVSKTKKVVTTSPALAQKPIALPAVQQIRDQETTVATSASSALAAREPRARRSAPSKRYPTDLFHVPDLGAPKKNKKTA